MDLELEAGHVHEQLFYEIDSLIFSGQSVYSIVDYAEDFLQIRGAFEIPETKRVTVNLNNVIYHGLPGDIELRDGDIVTVDICFMYKGVIIDGAKTYAVGDCSVIVYEMIDVSRESVKKAVDFVKAGVSVIDVVKFINDYILLRGFFMFRDGAGHGIGSTLHQGPYLSLNNLSDSSYIFKPGDKFTIEPIILLYEEDVNENIIGEGLVSSGNRSSQFEITLIIDEKGEPIVLNSALLK